MENILVHSKSDVILSGIFFKIFTNINSLYTFKILATLKKGDNAFVYCGPEEVQKLI